MNKYYYKDGTTSSILDHSKILHREDGPAVKHTDGSKFWYFNNKLHRTDGPAVMRYNNWKEGYVEYFWIDNENYSKKKFNKLIEEAKQLPLALRLIDPREWVRKTV